MKHLRTFNIKIIASILLFTCGILFFSLAVQKYQVLTSSQATLNLPQCEVPDGGSIPTNSPCASCSIFSDTAVDAEGNVAVQFGCQVSCNDSDNPLDTTGCPSGMLPYSISATSWYWCRAAGDHSCTDQNELTDDLITHIEGSGFTEGGPWIIARQGETPFEARFALPSFQSCGRIQVEIETNQKYTYVINNEVDCAQDLIAQAEVEIPTPTSGFGFPSENPTNTPIVQQTAIPEPTSTHTLTPSPSKSPTPTNSLSPTSIPSGSVTPSVSTTPSITGSITPTGTITPSVSISPTLTPTPTETPTSTPTPTPTFTLTPTPPQDITVNGEAPGITNWAMMLVPAALVMLGLLL